MTFEELQKMVTSRFSDLILIRWQGDDIAICDGPFLSEWRVAIFKYHLSLRPGHELHDDLIKLANDVRKEHYNVL